MILHLFLLGFGVSFPLPTKFPILSGSIQRPSHVCDPDAEKAQARTAKKVSQFPDFVIQVSAVSGSQRVRICF